MMRGVPLKFKTFVQYRQQKSKTDRLGAPDPFLQTPVGQGKW